MKLLLVEDDGPLRNITARNLKKAGYEVSEAENGQIGLERALAILPDLIVSDVMMPVLDGLGLVKAIRAEDSIKDCHIILLTAKDRSDDIIAGFDATADDYLTKPFKVNELVARVNAGSRLRKARLDLRNANESLSEALRQNAQLLGIAAHDLRNPLNIITTYISLLGKDVVPAEMIKEVCLRRAKSLSRLIDNLLDHTKIQSGLINLVPEEVSLRQLVQDTNTLFAPVAEEGEVTLSSILGKDLFMLFADRSRLIEILNTLFHNAITLAEEKSTVTITLTSEAAETVFTISNKSEWIGGRDPEKIFDSFEDSATTEVYDVSNMLGLAIVKKLVSRMGGTAFASHNANESGITIGFRLPSLCSQTP